MALAAGFAIFLIVIAFGLAFRRSSPGCTGRRFQVAQLQARAQQRIDLATQQSLSALRAEARQAFRDGPAR
jgi:hypothetical protein